MRKIQNQLINHYITIFTLWYLVLDKHLAIFGLLVVNYTIRKIVIWMFTYPKNYKNVYLLGDNWCHILYMYNNFPGEMHNAESLTQSPLLLLKADKICKFIPSSYYYSYSYYYKIIFGINLCIGICYLFQFFYCWDQLFIKARVTY